MGRKLILEEVVPGSFQITRSEGSSRGSARMSEIFGRKILCIPEDGSEDLIEKVFTVLMECHRSPVKQRLAKKLYKAASEIVGE